MRCLSEWMRYSFWHSMCTSTTNDVALYYISLWSSKLEEVSSVKRRIKIIFSLSSLWHWVWAQEWEEKIFFLNFPLPLCFAIHNARIHRMSPYSSVCSGENYTWNLKNLNLFIERKQFVQFTHAHSETVERCLNCWAECAELMWVDFGDMWSH